MAQQAITGEMVRYSAGNGAQVPGYLARPTTPGRYPGVVVIQEWWGLEEHIKDVARRFAGEGFVAIAPDLYHGKIAAEPDEARKLAMEMDRERATVEITSALDYLLTSGYVAGDRVGVIGFCMGGGLSLLTACKSPRVGAAVVFYGGNPNPIDQVANIKGPVLGIYGEADQGLFPDAVNQLRQALQQHRILHEVYTYPDAPHSFFCDARPQIYRGEAARDAWAKTLAFYRRHLPTAV
ncbi:MAG: dienelactone hydrolase family protein [Chloroflexi bacterium]|nr:dienelactone hydrolase family protein [Chloroflexota bacterium]